MKKFKVISAWLVVLAYIFVSLSFVSDKKEHTPCHFIDVNILDSLQNGFITKNAILTMVEKSIGKTLGNPLALVNTEQLEKEILQNRVIKKCDVYKTASGALVIDIVQRQPIVRIINQYGQSYYISEEGYLIPFSSIQTPNVLVATGFIKENKIPDLRKLHHVDHFNMNDKNNILSDIQEVAWYIYQNQFWKAQFVQLYVNKKGEIELIPRVGAHIIILGNSDGYVQKLEKLKTFYLKGLNNVGWNEYETINLKYKNQVICSKR